MVMQEVGATLANRLQVPFEGLLIRGVVLLQWRACWRGFLVAGAKVR